LFGLGGWELAIIIIFGFLIFGPDKLPQMARTIGRVIRQFRTAQEQMTNVIKAEVYDPIKDLEPLVNPFAGFSLDGSKEEAKKAEPAKKVTKTASTKKVESKSEDKDKTTTGSKETATRTFDTKATSEKEAEKTEPKVTSAAVAATASSGADKAKEQAIKDTAKKTAAASSTTESFAQRRARLEREHAKVKAAQETPVAPATPAPEERKEDEKSD
jgi:colicin import membrane protein